MKEVIKRLKDNTFFKNYDNGYGFEEFTFTKHIEEARKYERVRVRYILKKIEYIYYQEKFELMEAKE